MSDMNYGKKCFVSSFLRVKTHTCVCTHAIFGSKIYRKKKSLNFIEDISTKGVSPRGRETRGARFTARRKRLRAPFDSPAGRAEDWRLDSRRRKWLKVQARLLQNLEAGRTSLCLSSSLPSPGRCNGKKFSG